MRQTHWFRAGAAMVLIPLLVRGLSARIINVGTDPASPFTTIQAAIGAAAAQPGPDRIQIAAGQYLENLAISDADGLTLSGSSGVEIVADSLADAIQIALGDITISDLAIQAGDRGIAAGTVDSPVAALTLRDLVVMNNVKEGLNAVNVADVTVSGCTFRDNGGPAGDSRRRLRRRAQHRRQ